ncbi:sigma-54-dependent transcriptional regulator [Vibrio sp. WJH972]
MSNSIEPGQYNTFSVLIVDDEKDMQHILRKALSLYFTRVDCAGSVEEGEALRNHQHYDLVILDINLPGRSGIEWVEVFENKSRPVDVIFITGYATVDTAISALKLGATDFILKPFNLDQILTSVDRCMKRHLEQRKSKALSREINQHINQEIVGNSDKTKALKQVVSQYAPSKAPVLIEGESGTGKSLIARTLHNKSGRNGPFVTVSCSMYPNQSLEKELFGNGGVDEGLIRLANNGTLFLDEIDSMSLDLQGLLLRVLEQKIIRPMGSNIDIAIDVRIIAATSNSLQTLIDTNKFRSDLYYRLAVLKIDSPPLKQRKADLIELTPYFTQLLCCQLSLPVPPWINQYSEEMQNHEWPGNIRELRNLIERCLLLNKSPSQYWQDLQNRGIPNNGVVLSVSHADYSPDLTVNQQEVGYPEDWALKDIERAHILKVMKFNEGNKSAAARELGVSRKTLERKFKEWQAEEENTRD